MKKIIMTICAAVAMFTIVSCGNPAIKAAEKFLDNPTKENYKAIDKAMKDLSEEEKKEFEEWSEKHFQEATDALKSAMDKKSEESEE